MICAQPPIHPDLRITIPARERLVQSGNRVTPSSDGRWTVELHQPPQGLVYCLIGYGNEQHNGLRCEDEPAYPQEWPSDVIAWHEHGDWVPCPKCGGALVWYEAGYVPGYRLCTHGHHAQLSDDGRSARLVR